MHRDDEMIALHAALNSQRRHVLAAIEGLSDVQLTQSVLPSGWSCVGLLKHLALSDEHYWLRSIVGGESLDDFFPDGDGDDWTLADDETPASVIDLYRSEIAAADEALAGVAAADPPAQRDPQWDEWGIEFPTVRSVMLHMIIETATHAGHLDATRELLDGELHLVL